MKSELFKTYFRQPDSIPDEVTRAVSSAVPGESIRLYAALDLNARMAFTVSWAILTDKYIALAEPNGSALDGSWNVRSFPLLDIEKYELLEGLSNSRLNLVSTQSTLLISFYYTRRQSRAVGNLQFAAEQMRKRLKEPGSVADLAKDLDAAAEYQEAVFKSVKDSKATLSMPKMGVMLRLLSYMKPHKKVVIIAFVLSTLTTLLQLLPPYLTRLLVDNVIPSVTKNGSTHTPVMLAYIIGGLACVWGLGELMSFIRLRTMSIAGEKIAMKLREDVYTHMQKLSLSFFGSRSTGSLITRVSSDTDRLWDFVTFGVMDIAMSIIQIIGVTIALFAQKWSLAILVIIPLPIMTLMFYIHGRDIQVLFLRIWRKWSSMTGVLSDVIPGIRVVKAFAQEDHEVARFKEKNAAIEAEAIELHKNWTKFWPSVVMLMHTCSLIVWIVGAPQVLEYITSGGQKGIPLGVFIAFTGYMWMFWGPVQQLGMMSRTINRVTTSASRVFEVMDTVPSIVNKPTAITIPSIKGHVQFDNVTFSYDGVRNVLKGVSFDVRPGEMIGLVGPSGGGKTTLVNLICRFYDIKDGSVKVDNIDVRDMNIASLRTQIGVVLQEPYLFHGTISENISYGSHDIKLRDIIDSAKAANAHEFICGFPDGYETIVGERGQSLSGGERQRISIARAILHNPRLLILDEATSSVDTETEKRIQEALQRLVAGRTTFAIAHRLSTLSRADRLFVMEDGKLAEHGTHEELLAKPDGVYAKLHKTQMELHAAIAV